MGQVARDINLRAYSYHGITLPDQDPKLQGRYKIHIPEFHHLIDQQYGIWCKNQAHKWRWTPSEDYMYGEYYPLQPGTKVLIKFYENDFHTGYIDRIISDQVIKTTPKIGCALNPEATTDRDDVYMVFKTPKYHNLFLINEDTSDSENGLDKDLIRNSIHLYYNYRRSTMTINEDGIHWFTMDNRGVTIEGNNSEWVNKNEKVYIKQNRDLYIDGAHHHFTRKDYDSYICGEHREWSMNKHSTMSQAEIAEDAPTIWMNSGHSNMARQGEVNKGEDEIVVQKKIDTRVVAHLNRDDTYYGIGAEEIIGGVPPPPKETGDVDLCKINKGMNDRYSSVGANQVGATIIEPPEYPQKSGCGAAPAATPTVNITETSTERLQSNTSSVTVTDATVDPGSVTVSNSAGTGSEGDGTISVADSDMNPFEVTVTSGDDSSTITIDADSDTDILDEDARTILEETLGVDELKAIIDDIGERQLDTLIDEYGIDTILELAQIRCGASSNVLDKLTPTTIGTTAATTVASKALDVGGSVNKSIKSAINFGGNITDAHMTLDGVLSDIKAKATELMKDDDVTTQEIEDGYDVQPAVDEAIESDGIDGMKDSDDTIMV